MIGNLEAPSKLTTATASDEKSSSGIPYARLPRLERLRVSGKLDDTEEKSDEDEDVERRTERREEREEREKKKMRGKNKSLKRYLRKHRKNVIDPTTVITFQSIFLDWFMPFLNRLLYAKSWRNKRRRKGKLPLKHLARQSKTSHLPWIVSNGHNTIVVVYLA